MNIVRVFFAILPPKAIHGTLESILDGARTAFPKKTIRWIGLENLHITLQFISQVPQEQITVLIENICTLIKKEPSFLLHFGTLEWFPTWEHPKILSLAVEPQRVLKKLSGCINKKVMELGCSVESRPFRGHMSMGRLLKRNVARNQIKQIKKIVIPPVLINKVYLIESRPTNKGRLYCTLAEFNLA